MPLELSGQLTTRATDEQPSFEGCRIEVLFDDEPLGGRETPSAVSDAAGHFTLVWPDGRETAAETVGLAVLSPSGRLIGRAKVRTGDGAEEVTIEVDSPDPVPTGPVPEPEIPGRAAVDAAFRVDSAFRSALTENLKPLRAESEAIARRVETAFATFTPTPLSAEVLEARHYVEPDEDPGETLDAVIMDGVRALGSSDTKRTLTLRDSPELRGLLTEAPGDGEPAEGKVELDALVAFINGKHAGGSVVAEPADAPCRAELEAESRVAALESASVAEDGVGGANGQVASSESREADELVKESVNLQMRSATAPEARLDYGSMPVIPNAAGKDQAQSSILQTFELRPGASDVTSYHDFHVLQIAFQHVWTRIFDGQLESLGRELYREYVKLKDFSGSTDDDLRVSTVDDLRALMDEVKKLSQIVESSIPREVSGNGGGQKGGGTKGRGDLEDIARAGVAVLTGGASLLFEAALKELGKLGEKPVITWDDFGREYPKGLDMIEVSFVGGVAPAGEVEVVLLTDDGSHRKIIEFQPWVEEARNFGDGPSVSNVGHPEGYRATMRLRTSSLALAVLQFASQETETIDLGRYVLAHLEDRLKDRTRVTFHWKGV
jgi:hypothetical protein